MASDEQRIFKQGSTTYYWSSKFFPKSIREDVFKLYSFLRTVDDYVDSAPQQTREFYALRAAWEQYIRRPAVDTTIQSPDTIDASVIKNMLAVSHKYHFDPAWVEAFLDAMESDVTGKNYQTFDDTLEYVYGSAEVVGLMMSKIMGLPMKAYEAARMQGRAMQWANFIRDIAEDNSLGRCYFPEEDLRRFKLKDLSQKTAHQHPEAFRRFIQFQIGRYRHDQALAEKAYYLIARRTRIPIRTAAVLYDWAVSRIAENPFVVFDRQVKPSKPRVLKTGLKTVFTFRRIF